MLGPSVEEDALESPPPPPAPGRPDVSCQLEDAATASVGVGVAGKKKSWPRMTTSSVSCPKRDVVFFSIVAGPARTEGKVNAAGSALEMKKPPRGPYFTRRPLTDAKLL